MGQQETPHDFSPHGIIDTSKNIIKAYGSLKELGSIFSRLNSLAIDGTGRVNIVHLGDSHIQADYFSGRMRQHFSSFIPGGQASRGFIFPYSVAKTNNPQNYKVWYNGKWTACKNIQKKEHCQLGLSGISVRTIMPNSRITISQPGGEHPSFTFNKVKIFHTVSEESFSIRLITDAKIKSSYTDAEAGFTEFVLDREQDSLRLEFAQYHHEQVFFELHGISLETSDDGITYSATGINGADVPAWLSCPLLESQLACLAPDMIIISLGTNDGYNTHFNRLNFYEDYTALLKRIHKAVPEAVLLLTTPGDNYRYRTQLNNNTEKTQQIITQIAEENHCLLWDFYSIMGGPNSILLWQQQNLSAGDRLHYSKSGYILQGDMLFSAFMKLYDTYLDLSVRYHIPETLPIIQMKPTEQAQPEILNQDSKKHD